MPARKGAARPEKQPMPGVRERILDAAIAILRESGVRRLTQVQVAERAGVRQSHLTYYFPTREDLLAAVTARAVEGIARGVRRAVENESGTSDAGRLERLADAITDVEHMRMFVGMIVEADGVPDVRAMLISGTRRIEAALADGLGGEDATERAQLVLAAMWGVGLYHFLVRSPAQANLRDALLSWIGAAPTGRAPTRRRRRGAG